MIHKGLLNVFNLGPAVHEFLAAADLGTTYYA